LQPIVTNDLRLKVLILNDYRPADWTLSLGTTLSLLEGDETSIAVPHNTYDKDVTTPIDFPIA
jgi:hypothetical protein